MAAEYADPARPPISIAAIRNEALAAYDASPTPQTMLAIVGTMVESMADVIAMRNSVTDKEAIVALRPMDKEMDAFFERIEVYQVTLRAFAGDYGISKVAEYHDAGMGQLTAEDVPRIYNDLVVKPILNGYASATYYEYPWSKVVAPDVTAPARFANRITALDPSMFDFGTRVRFLSYDLLLWVAGKAEPEVKRYFKEKSGEYVDLAKSEIKERIPELVDAAREQIRETAWSAAEAGARKGAKKATAPYIAFAIGLGALALLKK